MSAPLYVGSIDPQNVTDDTVQELLRTCGQLVKWKRVLDASGSPKPFGFAEYANLDGLDKALRLLPAPTEWPHILLKIDVSMESKLQEYRRHAKADPEEERIKNSIAQLCSRMAPCKNQQPQDIHSLILRMAEERAEQENKRLNNAYIERLSRWEQRELEKSALSSNLIHRIKTHLAERGLK